MKRVNRLDGLWLAVTEKQLRPHSFSAPHGQDLNRDAFCTKTISQNISHVPATTQRYLDVQDTDFFSCSAS
jgi:hypothetical protein